MSFLSTMPAVSAVLAPSWSVKLLSISLSLSFGFLLAIALAVCYAAWTTKLIVQAVRDDRVDPLQGLADMPGFFLRILGAETLGWGVLFAGLAAAIAMQLPAREGSMLAGRATLFALLYSAGDHPPVQEGVLWKWTVIGQPQLASSLAA